MTLEEYASYVRDPKGSGLSGGQLELGALGDLTERDVYLWSAVRIATRSAGARHLDRAWHGNLVTAPRNTPRREGIHLSIVGGNHFNRLIWNEDARPPHQPAGPTTARSSGSTTTSSSSARDRGQGDGYRTGNEDAPCARRPG